MNLTSDNILQILYNLTTEVVPKISPNLKVVAHLVVPAGLVLAFIGWIPFNSVFH